MVCIASCVQEEQLAAERAGLLPEPTTMPATFEGTPPPHQFVRDPSGEFSRTMFETDEDSNFKLVVRDFSFPPDQQTHTLTLPSAALLHILGEPGEISIANRRLALRSGSRMPVPAGVPIGVLNNGERAVVVRVLIMEAK
jgi:hypothetical protein